jgi:hypothetical protein
MTEGLLDVTGGCHCGGVRYRATGVDPRVTECHCSQCRRQSGHRFATTGGKTSGMEIEGADQVTWYQASPAAERGFCSVCGSTLFWRRNGDDHLRRRQGRLLRDRRRPADARSHRLACRAVEFAV